MSGERCKSKTSLNEYLGLTLPPLREGKWGLHTVVSRRYSYMIVSRAIEPPKPVTSYSFSVSTASKLPVRDSSLHPGQRNYIYLLLPSKLQELYSNCCVWV